MNAEKYDSDSRPIYRLTAGFAFLIFAIGAVIQLSNHTNYESLGFAAAGIIILVAGRKFFTLKQRRTIYFGIILYIILLIIIIAGLTSLENSFAQYLSSGVSSLFNYTTGKNISSAEVFGLLAPYLLVNYGLCYYILSYRLIRGALHISIGIVLLVSVILRIGSVYLVNSPQTTIFGVDAGKYIVSIGSLVDVPVSVFLNSVAVILLTIALLIISLLIFSGRINRKTPGKTESHNT